METNLTGVFAAGDIVRGASLSCMGNQGWKRCCSINKKHFLKTKKLKKQRLLNEKL